MATSTDFMNSLQTETMGNRLLDEPAFCTICIDDIKLQDPISHLPCSHIFHHKCILEALSCTNMCPNCRREFPKQVTKNEFDHMVDHMVETWEQMLIAHLTECETLHNGLLTDRPVIQENMITTSLDDVDDVMESTPHRLTGRARKVTRAHLSVRERPTNGLPSRIGNRSYNQGIVRRGFNRSR